MPQHSWTPDHVTIMSRITTILHTVHMALMLDLHFPQYGFGFNQVSSIWQAETCNNSIFCTSLNATWTESHNNSISTMKGFMAVPGDGQQACCPFVFSKKICSHHSPLAWLQSEGHWKTKSHFSFQTKQGYSAEQLVSCRIYFYHSWHVQDMGQNVHSSCY